MHTCGRRLPWVVLLPLLFVASGCVVPQPRGAGVLKRIVEPTTRRGYWLYLPKDYVASDAAGRQNDRWPLVVSFHGMKPFDNARPQAREWQQEADRYGFVVVAPELKAPDVLRQFPVRKISGSFASDETATLAILDHVAATTRAEMHNTLSTSWSSGGYMAHYMMNRHPDRFSCLAVRQSNFSAEVLEPAMANRSIDHPILIINTQRDFGICLRESRRAIEWYERLGFKPAWMILKGHGHARTPDVAAAFFAESCGVEPRVAPDVLARRTAIDGNAAGLAVLVRPQAPLRAVAKPARQLARVTPPVANNRRAAPTPRTPIASRATPARGAQVASKVVPRSSTLRIRLSSAIGIEPLHVGFSAECPTNWQDTADFLWSLDGESLSNGLNGQKTITRAGEHSLSVLVVTAEGQEHRARRTIRVLPRVTSLSSNASVSGQ